MRYRIQVLAYSYLRVGGSQANSFIAGRNLVLGGVLVRQTRQMFGSCDPDSGLKHEFVTEQMQDQCELPESNKSSNMYKPFGSDTVFLATSKAFNKLLKPTDCYDITDKDEAFQYDSPYGFHFMRYGPNFKHAAGKDKLAGGEGNELYSYESMDKARGRGEEVEGSYPVYFDARWSERQANKFTT